MSKKLDNFSNMDLDFFMFRWITSGVIILLSIMIIFSTILFYRNKKQKSYYKNIIDTATNIVIINNKKTILDVNNVFFKYFNKYDTLDKFREENNCICNFFIEDNEYLKKEMDGVKWIDYLLEHNDETNIVKMNIYGNEYYFRIGASIVSEEEGHYSVVLADITVEEKYKKELEHLIITDSLTGIYNRRYFNKILKKEISRAQRYEHDLSLIMFDIDHFKKVNDTYGHNIGDEVLIEYTKLIKTQLRDTDVFCRIGGEEFMIILPHVNLNEAEKIAEKLRVQIQESKKILPITMSFGVVQYVLGEDSEHIYKRVDEALYKAKESGRNKVVVG
jgi:diguanylate cyclase (GGDEF)-like protein